MRRKDREVADLEGQLAILEQCPVCRVAINDPASGGHTKVQRNKVWPPGRKA